MQKKKIKRKKEKKMRSTAMNEAVGREWLHKLYIPSNPFLSVVQHWFNHVTIPHFTV